MGTKLIHTCDKCGTQRENSAEDLHKLSLQIASGNKGGTYSTHYGAAAQIPKQPTALFCRNCMKGLGLLPYTKEEQEKGKVPLLPPTIEDLIEDIVDAALDNRA